LLQKNDIIKATKNRQEERISYDDNKRHCCRIEKIVCKN
jgi:hypothetical protein